MKLEEIFEQWDKDSKIDRENLAEESIKIPVLHAKYFRILSNERLLLRKMEADMKQLKLDKFEFYTQGPNEDTPNTWVLPPVGKILKNDAAQYMDADKDIVEKQLKLAYQQEKLEVLDSIIKTLNNRGWQISNAISWIKFSNGV